MQEMDDETIYKERDNLVEQINYIAWSMINYLHENKEDVIDLYKDVNHKVPNYLNAMELPENSVNFENVDGFQKASAEFTEKYLRNDPNFDKYEEMRVTYLLLYGKFYIKIRELTKVMSELEKKGF